MSQAKKKIIFLVLGILGTIFLPKVSYAYPIFAQNAYQNPREATGRIVCANCHLAQKPIEIDIPQAVRVHHPVAIAIAPTLVK